MIKWVHLETRLASNNALKDLVDNEWLTVVVNSFKKGNIDCLLAKTDGLDRRQALDYYHYIDTVNKGQ